MMLLEVASLHVPVVCSDIPANTSVLPEQALFFRSGDVADLEQSLTWAIQHPEQMAELANRAHERVRQTFAWQKIISEYESLYQTLHKQ